MELTWVRKLPVLEKAVEESVTGMVTDVMCERLGCNSGTRAMRLVLKESGSRVQT